MEQVGQVAEHHQRAAKSQESVRVLQKFNDMIHYYIYVDTIDII